jgi:ABC-type bacteriocin/lantibiotic exporter with double-glycine peptidase domain
LVPHCEEANSVELMTARIVHQQLLPSPGRPGSSGRARTIIASVFAVMFAALCQGRAQADLDRSKWVRVDYTANWCGAKGLWLLAQGYGVPAELEEVKAICDPEGTSEGILSLSTLASAAESLGLAAQPVDCGLEWLMACPVPALTVHRLNQDNVTEDKIDHCYVTLSFDGTYFTVIDPFVPTYVQKIPDTQFALTWTGKALLVARRPEDLPRPNSWFSRHHMWVFLAVDFGLLAALVWTCRR